MLGKYLIVLVMPYSARLKYYLTSDLLSEVSETNLTLASFLYDEEYPPELVYDNLVHVMPPLSLPVPGRLPFPNIHP